MADLLEQAHDAVDRFVTGVGNALGVDFDGNGDGDGADIDDADPPRVRVTMPGRLPPSLSATPQPQRFALPAPAPAPAARTFEIVERDGRCFVTNGTIGRACPSRAYAEQLLAVLAADAKQADTKRSGRE